MTNNYKSFGCNNREEYLQMVADDHGVDIYTVHVLADMLGPNEDFDGLLTGIEDYINEVVQ